MPTGKKCLLENMPPGKNASRLFCDPEKKPYI